MEERLIAIEAELVSQRLLLEAILNEVQHICEALAPEAASG